MNIFQKIAQKHAEAKHEEHLQQAYLFALSLLKGGGGLFFTDGADKEQIIAEMKHFLDVIETMEMTSKQRVGEVLSRDEVLSAVTLALAKIEKEA